MGTWKFRLALAAALLAPAAHAADAVVAGESPQASAASEPAAASAAARKSKRALLAGLAVSFQPVTYADDAKVSPSVRECDVEKELEHDLSARLQHYHLGGAKTTSMEGRTLKIQIMNLAGESGGMWTGAKSLTLHVQLLADGHLERETDLTAVNVGANPFRGTCHVLHQHTKKLGSNIAQWLKDEPILSREEPADDAGDAETKDDKAAANR